MNEIIIKFLLVGDKCMPENHLRQSGCTYVACSSFTNNRERIQKIKEMRGFKDLPRRTIADNMIKHECCQISKFDRHQWQLASMVFTIFDKLCF